jgi:hypothetical protein
MNKFECSECGTKYSSPETTPPPGIKWSDGHVCTPKPVDNEKRICTLRTSISFERIRI